MDIVLIHYFPKHVRELQATALQITKEHLTHLNDADGFPWQMVGCVEQEGEEQNETAIPAKYRLKQRWNRMRKKDNDKHRALFVLKYKNVINRND